MTIQYMQNIQDFITQNPNHGNPISKEEIEKLELKTRKELPLSYKEFLILSGEFFDPIDSSGTGLSCRFNSLIEANENARLNLKAYGLEKLITKDFWVIAEMDGSVFINYIFLDEGENPPVYGLDMEGYTELPDMKDEFYGKITNTFSDFVESFIESYDPNYD